LFTKIVNSGYHRLEHFCTKPWNGW